MVTLTRLFDPNEREIKRHLAVAAAVNELEPELKALDDAGLRARSDELRQRARDGEELEDCSSKRSLSAVRRAAGASDCATSTCSWWEESSCTRARSPR